MFHRTSRNRRIPKLNSDTQDRGTLQFTPRRFPAALALMGALTLVGFRVVTPSAGVEEQPAAIADQMPAPNPDPAGTIDGAKNPELIPDDVAWRLLMLAVMEPPNATEEQKARARAKLAPAGLSAEDEEALLTLLADLHKQLTALDAQAAEVFARSPFPHPASTDWQHLRDLGRRRHEHIRAAAGAVPARLSAEGATGLSAYVQQAKQGMMIYPPSSDNLMPPP